jgi:6-phosphogluconolactonase (cycloisomerase 2 family)
MKFANIFPATAAWHVMASPTSASALNQGMNLFVSSYSGVVRSINLSGSGHQWTLKNIADNTDCGKSPSWLTYDAAQRRLYCLNEGLEEANGSVTALSVSKEGLFSKAGGQTLLQGPVSGTITRRGNRSELIIAHYRYILSKQSTSWN